MELNGQYVDKVDVRGYKQDDDLQSGIDQYVGHGKRYLGQRCHLRPGTTEIIDDLPGLHGHYKGDDMVDALPRYLGNGLRKFDRSMYHRHHISDDVESDPGLHGHHRQLDYQEGMPRHIGHGKVRLFPDHSKETWRPYPKSETGESFCHADYRAAGLSTRDFGISKFSRDPTRQGTHQDRRKKKEFRRDQFDQIII
jgi:hypothetical protein